MTFGNRVDNPPRREYREDCARFALAKGPNFDRTARGGVSLATQNLRWALCDLCARESRFEPRRAP